MGGPAPAHLGAFPAYMYLLKSYVGPGCLALPFAFTRTGSSAGVAVMLTLAVLCAHSSQLLIEVGSALRRTTKAALTYPDVARLAVGPFLAAVVTVFITAMQVGVCAVYFSFVAVTVRKFVDVSAVVGDNDMQAEKRFCMLMELPLFVALAVTARIRGLAQLALVANVFMFLGLFIVVMAAGTQLFEQGGSPDVVPVNQAQLPLGLACMMYTFEGVANILPMMNATGSERVALRVATAAFVTITVLFIVVGYGCYLAFPNIDSGAITVVLARQSTAGDQNLVLVVNLLCAAAVIMTFPIQLFPVIELFEAAAAACGRPAAPRGGGGATKEYAAVRVLGDGRGGSAASDDDDDDDIAADRGPRLDGPAALTPVAQFAVRTAITAGVFVLAVSVPNLSMLIEIIGAWLGAAIAMFIPALIHFCWIWQGAPGGSLSRCSCQTTRGRLVFALLLDAWVMGIALFVIGVGGAAAVGDVMGDGPPGGPVEAPGHRRGAGKVPW